MPGYKDMFSQIGNNSIVWIAGNITDSRFCLTPVANATVARFCCITSKAAALFENRYWRRLSVKDSFLTQSCIYSLSTTNRYQTRLIIGKCCMEQHSTNRLITKILKET